MASKSKYYIFCCLLFCSLSMWAQYSNDAVVTIIGDDPASNNTNDFVNTNQYDQPVEPPVKQKLVKQEKTIEPTLENGFHMRFEISYAQPNEQVRSSSFASTSDNYGRVRKRTVTLTERSFNAKKKFRTWMPHRKKKYKPTNCGRF